MYDPDLFNNTFKHNSETCSLSFLRDQGGIFRCLFLSDNDNPNIFWI